MRALFDMLSRCLSVSDREALIFYKRLMKTYGATGSELPTWAASRCPNINGTPIFLYELYSIVTGLGGHEKVINVHVYLQGEW